MNRYIDIAPHDSNTSIRIEVRDEDNESIQENMLAALLISGQVSLNNHWWEKTWITSAQSTFSINICVNDIFYGGSDAEEFTYSELEEVFRFFEGSKKWGLIIWSMKKRENFNLFRIPIESIERDIGMSIDDFILINSV